MNQVRTAAAPAPHRTRRRLGEVLMAEGLLTEDQLLTALASGQLVEGRRERLGQAVVRLGYASEQDVARALAAQLGLACLERGIVPVDEAVTSAIPSALALRHLVVPLEQREDGTLVVACVDPTNVVALDDVRLAAGVRAVQPVVAPASAVNAAIRKAYGFDARAGDLLDSVETEKTEEPATENELARSTRDAPIVRLAEGILVDALEARASDVHVEPGRTDTAVRYRIDGVLHHAMTLPKAATGPLISRLKLMAGMDIAERRRPQDGRSRVSSAEGASVDLRVSTLPSMFGETLVIRLLRGTERLPMDQVGLSEEQQHAIRLMIERPQGLVLVTGPTGSGKTSTLYGFLEHLAQETSNIITLEDPIEYQLPGVNQTQIHEQIGLTFASALRTVLRQDPDVVMVGEVRDPETAELAMQASLTGHLVFSTLHTNDAPGAVVRLRDLGIPSYLIASSLSLVLAQRLARQLCPSCSVPKAPTEAQMAQLHLSPRDVERADFRVGAGCPACNHTGFRGRVGVFEVLVVDSAIRELLSTGAEESAIRQTARIAGMRSLREDGLRKAMAGLTTLDEVLRVTPADVVDEGVCPLCARAVEPDFALCPYCAADLRPDRCTTCERALAREWRLCPSCGTPAHSELTAAPSLPKVLVIDDDASVRAAIRAMLTGDYECVEAADALDALDAVHRERPDAVLLDVGLPGMDGYEVLRELRSRPTTMHLPVLLVTGHDDPAHELKGLRSGADDYLTKPLDPDVLLARLGSVLRRTAVTAR